LLEEEKESQSDQKRFRRFDTRTRRFPRIMATRMPETDWIRVRGASNWAESSEPEELLEQLRNSFAQVNIAADFLLLELDPSDRTPQLQLVCLVKERLAAIQEQVRTLYQALSRGGISTCPALEQ
jgi:hypothetical protein